MKDFKLTTLAVGQSVKNVVRLLALSSILMAGISDAQDVPGIIRYRPDGADGKGLIGPMAQVSERDDRKTTTYTYYKSLLNPRIDSGVWEATNFQTMLRKTRSSEFIHLIEGSIILTDASGHDEVFKPGDNLVIPRGANVAWKKTDHVKEFWVSFDGTLPGTAPVAGNTPPASTDAPTPAVIRLEPDGPADKGLKPHGKTKEYVYFKGEDKSFVGVWETQPDTSSFDKTKYAELMIFLKGSVTLSTPSGQSETFHAGEAALVPRGIDYKWSSDTARKFYVIFDTEPKPAAVVTTPSGN
jgi:uncharacterized cupin superfamily protein